MKRHRIAAVVVFIQAIVLPTIYGSLGGPDWTFVLVLEVVLALLCVAMFVAKPWALRAAFILMLVQIPAIESDQVSWGITAGSSLSVGLLKTRSWLESRLALNRFTG